MRTRGKPLTLIATMDTAEIPLERAQALGERLAALLGIPFIEPEITEDDG